MRIALLTATLVMLLATSAAAVETPTGIELSDSELQQIAGGEPVIRTQRGELNRGEVVGLVDAPLEAVMEVVLDFEKHDEWFPDMLVAEIITRTSNGGHGRGETHMPWPVANRTWEINTTYRTHSFGGVEGRLIQYEYVPGSGNLEEMHGYWVLLPHNGGQQTLVKYVINANLGIWLPNSIINWATRRMLPGIIEGLNDRT